MNSFKSPKDSQGLSWTTHIKGKMLRYRISESMIKRILRYPSRQEIGIAENTVAAMKRNEASKKKEEIWIMYQLKSADRRGPSRTSSFSGRKITLISAWRYPGHTKNREELPKEILAEIKEALL